MSTEDSGEIAAQQVADDVQPGSSPPAAQTGEGAASGDSTKTGTGAEGTQAWEKQVADAKMTPAQLRDAARAFQIVADKAKAMGVTVSDEMDEPAIMRTVVSAKLGDAAKDWTDAQFAASFSTLTASFKAADSAVHNLNPAIQIGDAESAFAESQRKLSDQRRNAWKTPAPAAVA